MQYEIVVMDVETGEVINADVVDSLEEGIAFLEGLMEQEDLDEE